MSELNKLLSIAQGPLAEPGTKMPRELYSLSGTLNREHVTLLEQRNGFYAFESALHLFPSYSVGSEIGVLEWNSDNLWRTSFNRLADGCFFFGEDVFGGQFCIKDDKIHIFEPETGALEFLADNFEDWASSILSDFDLLTGYSLAHRWQIQNGPIPPGKRLLPKIPFVVGGEFALENLYLVDSVKGMRFRGELAIQIKDLPDGAEIKFELVE